MRVLLVVMSLAAAPVGDGGLAAAVDAGAPSADAAPASPFEGYGGMRWGTGIDTAKARLGAAKLDASYGDAMPVLTVKDEVAGSSAFVSYFFIDGKLAQAQVHFVGRMSADDDVALFDRIASTLRSKYGSPLRDSGIDNRNPRLETTRGTALMVKEWMGKLTWAKPGGQVELFTIWSDGPFVLLTATSNEYAARVNAVINDSLKKSNEKGL